MRKLLKGDCLERLRELPDGSIDCVIADPPYGTTRSKWDSIIPLEPMWTELRRVVRKGGAAIFFAAQPFASALVMSNPAAFKYEDIWDKRNSVGFLNAKVMPLRQHESILLFCEGRQTYHPQMRTGELRRKGGYGELPNRGAYGDHAAGKVAVTNDQYYPTSIVQYPRPLHKRTHPNEKPVDLCAYLVRTYTDPGETVLDFCMGSGTTGVACVREGRDFVGIERDDTYYATARERILAEVAKLAEAAAAD